MERELQEFVLRAYGVELTRLDAWMLSRLIQRAIEHKEMELVMGKSNGEPVGLR